MNGSQVVVMRASLHEDHYETIFNSALANLVNVICLCQVPKEQWSEQDVSLYREAREFVQEYRKLNDGTKRS
jgi:hypothetical protein